jgi:hypothetical protein
MSPVGWEALELWGDDVARIEPFAGGVANQVWSVRVNGQLAVVRLGARSDADLAWETDLLRHLDREGLTVPVPLSTEPRQKRKCRLKCAFCCPPLFRNVFTYAVTSGPDTMSKTAADTDVGRGVGNITREPLPDLVTAPRDRFPTVGYLSLEMAKAISTTTTMSPTPMIIISSDPSRRE